MFSSTTSEMLYRINALQQDLENLQNQLLQSHPWIYSSKALSLSRVHDHLTALRLRAMQIQARQNHQSDSVIEQILQALPNGLSLVNNSGHITFANNSLTALTGYTSKELLGNSYHQLLCHSASLSIPIPEDECPIHTTLRTNTEIHRSGETHWHKNGDSFLIELTVVPLSSEHKNTATALISLYRTPVHASIDKAKVEFLSTVSHKLLTPLASVLGFTELLLKRDFPPEKQKELLTLIHTESTHLTALVNTLLDNHTQD